ncbi:hypothetical protein RRG08_047068 [Elysia crispata]|uniref:Uncharacterized protein n=1 Tax=Elysia crispata TaxID=231223 RepID=A0AAE1AV02_9GAST|nr:hypothetical protein RRG08_047068 [Elysia crispata]
MSDSDTDDSDPEDVSCTDENLVMPDPHTFKSKRLSTKFGHISNDMHKKHLDRKTAAHQEKEKDKTESDVEACGTCIVIIKNHVTEGQLGGSFSQTKVVLSVCIPRRDPCDVWISAKFGHISNDMHKKHLDRKTAAHQEKEKDKTESDVEACGTCIVIIKNHVREGQLGGSFSQTKVVLSVCIPRRDPCDVWISAKFGHISNDMHKKHLDRKTAAHQEKEKDKTESDVEACRICIVIIKNHVTEGQLGGSFSQTKVVLSVCIPRRDPCDVWISAKFGHISNDMHKKHLDRKTAAHQEKEKDKTESDVGTSVWIMDFQSVLISPNTQASEMFYKTK